MLWIEENYALHLRERTVVLAFVLTSKQKNHITLEGIDIHTRSPSEVSIELYTKEAHLLGTKRILVHGHSCTVSMYLGVEALVAQVYLITVSQHSHSLVAVYKVFILRRLRLTIYDIQTKV